MPTSRWHYLKELSEQLRINGVPEAQVTDIVGEVEAHLRATGDDPVAAFGQPVDYAASWKTLSPRRWIAQILLGACLGIGIVAGVRAVFAGGPWSGWVDVESRDLVMAAWMTCAVGVIPWTAGLLESRRRASRLGDPHIPSPWPLRIVVMGVLATLVGAGSYLLMDDAGDWSVLFAVPRWLLAAVSVVGVAVGFGMGPSPNSANSPPRPPGSPPKPLTARIRHGLKIRKG